MKTAGVLVSKSKTLRSDVLCKLLMTVLVTAVTAHSTKLVNYSMLHTLMTCVNTARYTTTEAWASTSLSFGQLAVLQNI